jgi:hypothetical protein
LGINNHSLDKQFVIEVLRKVPIECFIETGTYLGDTAFWASHHFKKVYSIEMAEELWNRVKEKYTSLSNVEFILGDSRDKLEELNYKINCQAVYWLDAHWSAGVTAGKECECPLLGEIEVINQSKLEHLIMIDDARLFLFPPPLPHDPVAWPDIYTVLNTLYKRERYVVILNDIIFAMPVTIKPMMMSYFQEIATETWRNSQVAALPKGKGVREKMRRFLSKE